MRPLLNGKTSGSARLSDSACTRPQGEQPSLLVLLIAHRLDKRQKELYPLATKSRCLSQESTVLTGRTLQTLTTFAAVGEHFAREGIPTPGRLEEQLQSFGGLPQVQQCLAQVPFRREVS